MKRGSWQDIPTERQRSLMEIHLADQSNDVVNAWRQEFAGVDNILIHCADILELASDTLVSPANSYGFMDGGIDRLYVEFFGPELESRVQDSIRRTRDGLLPVGAALIISTGHERIPRLVVAPTMILPGPVRPENCFYAMSAALLACQRHREEILQLWCPGLCTGVGGVDPGDAAREMAFAVKKHRGRFPADP